MKRIKVLCEDVSIARNAHLPKYMSAQAAGMDLCANIVEPVTLEPGGRKLIPAGIAIALPENIEAQIRPRSGLALKNGVTVLNAPGTIDADYRGEIGVILINLGDAPFVVLPGARIAQMIFSEHKTAEFEIVQELPESGRMAGGFGSTGTALKIS